MSFDGSADTLHFHIFLKHAAENKVALRRDRFQVRKAGQYIEEALSLIFDKLHFIQGIIQVLEGLDSSKMARNVDLKGALSSPHIGNDPRGKDTVANA